MQPDAPNVATVRLERIAGRDCIVIASVADPLVCNVITLRDPEYAALLARAAVTGAAA